MSLIIVSYFELSLFEQGRYHLKFLILVLLKGYLGFLQETPTETLY